MNFLKNCPLYVKLGIGFGCVIAFMILISSAAYMTMNSIRGNVSDLEKLSRLEKTMIEREGDHLRFMAKASLFFYEPATAKMEVETNHRECALGKWLYGEGRKDAVKQLTKLAPVVEELKTHHEKLHGAIAEINTLAAKSDKEEILPKAKEIFDAKATTAMIQVRAELSKVKDILKGETEEVAQAFERKMKASTRNNIFLTIAAISVGLLSSWLVTRFVSKSIGDVVSVNEKLAQGDMTVRSSIDQNDEIGKLAAAANTLAAGSARFSGV